MEECEIKVTRLFKTNKTGSNYGFTIETKNYNKSVYPVVQKVVRICIWIHVPKYELS